MLHVPTLLLAILIGFLLLTLELVVIQRRLRQRPELRDWTLGCWLVLGGFAMLGARVMLPLSLSIVAGNWLICAGAVCYVRALYRLLLDRPAPRWLLLMLALLPLALVAMLDWPLNRRTSLLSVGYAVCLVPCVTVIVRHGWHAERSLRTVAMTMLLSVVALMLRAVHAWQAPAEYTDLMQASLGQSLTFLMAFMSLLGAGFGFVLAVFERVAQQLEVMATHDGLTGCLNRITIDTLLEHTLSRGHREGAPVAFVLLDLDHFKQINDQHGHRTGDAVLRSFAATVRERLRSSDVFGRTGGEEFGLVLPATDVGGARRLLEGVREAVAALHLSDAAGRPVRVTVSAGIAVAASDAGLSADRLYGRADQALYQAKHNGRNRVEVYAEDGPDSALRIAPAADAAG